MRCRLGEKKLRSYSKKFEKDFTLGLVRGNTRHRVDLFTAKESFSYYPHTFIKDNEEIRGRDLLVINSNEKGRPRETIPTYETAIDFIVTMRQNNIDIQEGD
jgi:hypothetical protein